MIAGQMEIAEKTTANRGYTYKAVTKPRAILFKRESIRVLA